MSLPSSEVKGSPSSGSIGIVVVGGGIVVVVVVVIPTSTSISKSVSIVVVGEIVVVVNFGIVVVVSSASFIQFAFLTNLPLASLLFNVFFTLIRSLYFESSGTFSIVVINAEVPDEIL